MTLTPEAVAHHGLDDFDVLRLHRDAHGDLLGKEELVEHATGVGTRLVEDERILREFLRGHRPLLRQRMPRGRHHHHLLPQCRPHLEVVGHDGQREEGEVEFVAAQILEGHPPSPRC
jgi:hypothetical protein